MNKKSIVLGLSALIFTCARLSAALKEGETVTESNWSDLTVGFKPDGQALGGLTAGSAIDKSNADKAKEAIPEGLRALIDQYDLKLPLRDYAPIAPSGGYIEATNQYSRSAKLIETGDDPDKKGIEGYVAGLPFPMPENGLEAAWNFLHHYEADNFQSDFKIFWINPKRGVERSQTWAWEGFRRPLSKTDMAPKPAMPQFSKDKIFSITMVKAKEPFDVSGLRQMFYANDWPSESVQWVYIPALRRVRQLSYGLRGDVFNSTDLFVEDARGYSGFVEWQKWKLSGKKTILGSMHADMPNTPEGHAQAFELKSSPYVNFTVPWEPRPVYVVEAQSKYPQYPYGKMVFYIDAETNLVLLKEGYDRKGNLWKTIVLVYNAHQAGLPPDLRALHVIDHRIRHATLFYLWNWRYNDPSISLNDFTITAMRRNEGRGN